MLPDADLDGARRRLGKLRAELGEAKDAEVRARGTCELLYAMVGEGNLYARQMQPDAIAMLRMAGRRRADLERAVNDLESWLAEPAPVR